MTVQEAVELGVLCGICAEPVTDSSAIHTLEMPYIATWDFPVGKRNEHTVGIAIIHKGCFETRDVEGVDFLVELYDGHIVYHPITGLKHI